ncbi:MAG TPA: hypothetical protein VFA20_26875 [Myxococcaceae bacterium]|nr:hypothetical protein [Myxococcaceae bacterium]
MAELDSTLPLSSHSSAAAHAPAWLETAALTALALTAGALVGGRDALVLRPELAWLALAPLLAGLRSGPGHGVACAAAQAGALLAAAHWGNAVAEVSLGQLALAWVIAGLLAGWFRDAWMRRLGQAEAQETSLRGQLDVLARGYRALRASHERLKREGADRARRDRRARPGGWSQLIARSEPRCRCARRGGPARRGPGRGRPGSHG